MKIAIPSFSILLALGGCTAATHPECPALEPADLIGGRIDRMGGDCPELAAGSLAYCWDAINPGGSEPTCTVDAWACQSVTIEGGASYLSRLDLSGPITETEDGAALFVATATGYYPDGRTCTGHYSVTVPR